MCGDSWLGFIFLWQTELETQKMNVHVHGPLNNSKIHFTCVKNMCCIRYKLKYYEEFRRCVSYVPHYTCMWHLWKHVDTNFKRTRITLSDLFFSMGKTYRKEDFNKLMAKVEKVNRRVKEYLEDDMYKKWSRVHSTVNRGRIITSNIA